MTARVACTIFRPMRWVHGRMRPLVSMSIVGAMVASGVHAQRPDRETVRPGVRNAHILLSNGPTGGVILFGGADEARVRSDTWRWRDGTWHQVATSGPSPRTFPAGAYDVDRHLAYVFGGNRVLFGTDSSRNTFLGDLWALDGGRWRRLSEDGPRPRAEASMAYDERRHRLVLFGGYYKIDSLSTRLADTWEWDGRSWTLVADSGPTGRNNAAMVYDPARGVTVLFGGSDGTASGETWEWDGNRWSRSAPPTDPRYNTVMWYDVASRRLIRFGGWFSGQRWGDTWAYQDGRWTRLDVSGPSPRNHASVAYDYASDRAILLGGHDGDHVFGDLWAWSGTRWLELDSVPPKLRVNNGH